MNKLETAIINTILAVCGLALVGLLILLIAALFTPSCQDKGGKSVANGQSMMLVMVGKVMVPQMVTQYKCVIPEK